MLDQDRAHDGGIIRVANFGNGVRDEIELPMRIDQGKRRGGNCVKGKVLGVPVGKVLDYISQEFQLVNQMRVFRRIDGGEFHFQERQLAVHAIEHLLGNFRGPVMNELRNLGHAGIVGELISQDKQVVSPN